MGDEVFEGPDGAKIFVDKKSLLFLNGTVLDYDTSLVSKGFVVQQPEREVDLRLRQFVRGIKGSRVQGSGSRVRIGPRTLEPLNLRTIEPLTCHAFSIIPAPTHPGLPRLRRRRAGRRALLPAVHEDPVDRPARGLLHASLGLPRKLNLDPAELEQRFRDAQPPVSSRTTSTTRRRPSGAREPRALVLPERRLPDAEAADCARRVPARSSKDLRRRGPEQAQAGSAGAARRSVRAERGARRDPRPARVRRAGRRAGRRGSSRRAVPIERKRDAHEARPPGALRAAGTRSSTARAGIVERRPVLEALRERVLERNYINNLLAGIERETDDSEPASSASISARPTAWSPT